MLIPLKNYGSKGVFLSIDLRGSFNKLRCAQSAAETNTIFIIRPGSDFHSIEVNRAGNAMEILEAMVFF